MPFSQQQLLRALDRQEFVPHFQPLVDLRSGEIHGFEILARWEHPKLGFISPAVFIPLLEQYRLMNNLTAALLGSAFNAVRTLPSCFGLSVNLSPPQLHDRSLPGLIQLMAEEAEFDLGRLTVELTETALVDDLELAGKVAEDLKRRRIRLALDDFGTGYSSLLHLQSLPFDELKIDASFVRSMTESRQSRKITAAVISLGLSLGLKTVAEGIEEQSQANLLAWQGCDVGQGFLYGRAVPAEQLGGFFDRPEPFAGVTGEVPAAIAGSLLSVDARPAERFSQLRAIYDSAPVGLAFVDRELRYVSLNQRLAQGNGRTVQDHLGRKVADILPPALYAQVEPYILRALQGESFAPIEVAKEVPGEPSRTLMVSYQPVHDEAGEILGVCISISNLSAVKQNEEALRESEDHYRNTVELNPQIPWVADAQGNIISLSSRWAALTGKPGTNFGWFDAVHPEDRQNVLNAVGGSLQTGNPLDMEYRLQCRESVIWVRSRGYPRRDRDGRIIRWYGSVEDIDQHKRALEELRRSEARLRAIFEAAPAGIAIVESETFRVLSANPRMQELIGAPYKPGMTWQLDAVRVFDRDGSRLTTPETPLARCMRTGETIPTENLLVHRADGSYVWVRLTVAPVRLENGTQWGAVVIAHDIEATRREHPQITELSHIAETARPAQFVGPIAAPPG